MKTIREILEEYKKKIHGSEYDYHSKHHTLTQHEEFMNTAQLQAEAEIKEAIKEKMERAYRTGFYNATNTKPTS